MSSMTFQVNDATASTTASPAVWVTVTEQADGTLLFTVTQQGGIIGDLRGIFFDVADESVINSLVVTPASAGLTKVQKGNDAVKDLGNGANMQGLLGGTGGADTAGYDVGLEIGSSGIGKDDYRSFSFVLDSTLRNLTLADMANVNFGVRLTSVGKIGGSRADSSKLLETTSAAIDAQLDKTAVDENNTASGNVLDNDKAGLPATDAVTVTGWSGGALGETIFLSNAEGATLTLNADGSYTLDASAADALSQGEALKYTFTYTAQSVNEATSWSSDTTTFTVTVNGANDGPVAVDDTNATTEAAPVSGNVLTNDSDIDRLDTISVIAVEGVKLIDGAATVTLASGGTVTINADGTYTYDSNGVFTYLMTGQQLQDTFTYTITDNHGAHSTATVTISIDGIGQYPYDPLPELPTLGLSHGYWMNHDGGHQPNDWNIGQRTSFEDYFGIDIDWSNRVGGSTVHMDDVSFREAAGLNGGGVNALAREAVTAILNALDEKNGTTYDFAYTVDQVKQMVHDAYVSGDAALIEQTKDLLLASHD